MENNDKQIKMARCHKDKKEKAKGMCASCYQKWWESKHPEYVKKYKQYHKEWRQKNPEKSKEYRTNRKEKDKNNPDHWIKTRNKLLMSWYGMTQQDYEFLLKKQNGVCALCMRAPRQNISFHVDHDHETGFVRGLLCHRCNWYLGIIDKDPKILERIIKYKNQTTGDFKCLKKRKHRQRD